MIKMSIGLTRLQHLTQDEFLQYWQNEHAILVRSLTEVLGIRKYVQQIPLPSDSGLKSSSQFNFDGIAEVWFDDAESILVGHRQADAKLALAELSQDEARFMDQEKSVVWWSEEKHIK